MALPAFKRIVTGHDSDGRAIVVLQGAPRAYDLEAVPGTVFHEIWNTSGMPVRIDDGPDPTTGPITLGPPPAGSRIRVVDIPPDSVQNRISEQDAATAFAAIGASHASATGGGERHRLMHRTETLDYGIVIAGTVWLVLDDGEVELHPGDIVVQRGTNHAWSNRTEQMARMVFVLLEGRYAEPPP
jgi:naringenin degradation protein FdeH